MSKSKNRRDTEAQINARAWKDSSFKKKLLAHPNQALKEMGMKNIPADIQIRVIEEEKNQWYIVLQVPPEGYDKMSQAELEKIAAAGGASNCVPSRCDVVN